MYQIGDLVVYGNTGVCRVEDITTLDGMGERKYYLMKPIYQSEIIYVPIDNTKVFIRPVISPEEVNDLIDRIPEIDATPCSNRSAQELKEYYQASTQTHECQDLIELVMSIYAKKQSVELQNRKLGQVDEKYMRHAEDMLHGEFAVVLGIEKEEVSDYIAGRLKNGDKE